MSYADDEQLASCFRPPGHLLAISSAVLKAYTNRPVKNAASAVRVERDREGPVFSTRDHPACTAPVDSYPGLSLPRLR